jgi:hypothetical protein
MKRLGATNCAEMGINSPFSHINDDDLYSVILDIPSSIIGIDDFVTIIHGDNKIALTDIAATRDKNNFGMIYFDPNGPKNLDFGLIKDICNNKNFHFVDILIRVSGTAYKRTRNGLNGYGLRNNLPHLVGKYPNLKDQLLSVNKKCWLIRDIIEPDPSQWTFLLGTNWTEYPAWETERFYKAIDLLKEPDARGVKILDRVAYTQEELDEI